MQLAGTGFADYRPNHRGSRAYYCCGHSHHGCHYGSDHRCHGYWRSDNRSDNRGNNCRDSHRRSDSRSYCWSLRPGRDWHAVNRHRLAFRDGFQPAG